MKLKFFGYTFNFKTKRKSCPECNGKAWIMTDVGKDGCESCLNTGKFDGAFHNCLDGFGMGNLFYFRKYLSSKDFQIAEEINSKNNKIARDQGHFEGYGL